MDEWIQDDPNADHKAELYKAIADQYVRYVTNVVMNVGGIYLNDVKEGTPGKKHQVVSKAVQKKSLKWALKQYRDLTWLDNKELTSKFPLELPISFETGNKIALSILNASLSVYAANAVADSKYSVEEYFDDLYLGIWDATLTGRKLTLHEKQLQRQFLVLTSGALDQATGKGVGGQRRYTLEAFTPSVNDICLYGLDESGMISRYENVFRKIEDEYGRGYVAQNMGLTDLGKGYGWQQELPVQVIADLETYLYKMGIKVAAMLSSRMESLPVVDRPHYQKILFVLKQMEKK